MRWIKRGGGTREVHRGEGKQRGEGGRTGGGMPDRIS